MAQSGFRTLLLCLLMVLMATIVAASVPQLITYQGRLTSSTGTPFTGAKLVKFTIYSGSGIALWNSGFIAVTCSDGLFSVDLGSAGQPALPAVIFSDAEVTLGITVDTDPEISPRTKITSQAFAYRALNADTAFAAHALFNNTVTSDNIVNGTIAFEDMGQNGAAANQVMKWNGAAWVAANDDMGAGGAYLPLAGGIMTGPITNTGNPGITMGKGNFGDANVNSGAEAFVAGKLNFARGDFGTITGGQICQADGHFSAVGGGEFNRAMDTAATVAGGKSNLASGKFSFIGGGGSDWVADSNVARGRNSSVVGGSGNIASADWSSIGGGKYNRASGLYSSVGGGYADTASGYYATVAGGIANVALDSAAAVCGGNGNRATGMYSFIGGGGGIPSADANNANGRNSVVTGGSQNIAGGEWSVVGGGFRNNARGLYSVIGGGGGYSTDSNSAQGQASVIAGGSGNVALGALSVVGGGNANISGAGWSTVSGGFGGSASGEKSTIGGGWHNLASGISSTVPGGEWNWATGDYSFAAGFNAQAFHEGAIVLSDHSGGGFVSVAANEFCVRATGGTRIYTSWPPGPFAGVSLAPGAGAWASISDSVVKRNIRPVDGKELLEKIQKLPVSRWSYKSQDSTIEHIGPMAQDFYALFKVGESDSTISTIDPSGIALAAIKELAGRNATLQAEVEQLKKQVLTLVERMNTLSDNKNKIENILSSK